MGDLDYHLALVLTGHQKSVESVTITKDDCYILSGSLDQTVRVWDYKTGQCTRILEDPTKRALLPIPMPHKSPRTITMENTLLPQQRGDPKWAIFSVAPTPDGKYVVASCDDGTVRVWDLASGTLVHRLWGHAGLVYAISIIPDGSQIASAATDGTVRFWNLPSGSPGPVFSSGKDVIRTLAFMPDGRHLVGGSTFGRLYVWEVGTSTPARSFVAHDNSVLSVAVTPDGKFIISGGFDRVAKVWEFPSEHLLRVLEGHADTITSVAVSADGNYVVSGSEDKTIRIWQVATGNVEQILPEPEGAILTVTTTLDDGCVISGSSDHTLYVWARAGFARPEWDVILHQQKAQDLSQFAHTIDERNILDLLEKPSSIREIIMRAGIKDIREARYLTTLLSQLEKQGKISKGTREDGISYYQRR